MVKWFARIPFASVTLPQFSGWWVVGFYAGIGVVYFGKLFFKKDAPVLFDKKLMFAELFIKFQKVPKGVLIDNPNELVVTNFITSNYIRSVLPNKLKKVYFTRRSLKHIAEKGIEGERLLKLIPTIFGDPEIIYEARESNRWLILKALPYQGKILLHGVVVEKLQSEDILIVTSFVAKQKYLKNFKILWRTAAS
jgi:hypothetical protein